MKYLIIIGLLMFSLIANLNAKLLTAKQLGLNNIDYVSVQNIIALKKTPKGCSVLINQANQRYFSSKSCDEIAKLID